MTVNGVHLRVLTVGIGQRGRDPGRAAADRGRRRAEQPARAARGRRRAWASLLAAALGAIVARTALRPVRRFTRTTEALTGDPDLSHRLEETGRDELTRLARSFNRTLDALERSAAAQRNLVADASHELRTPIASLRANIQVLEDADRLAPDDLAALRADIISELDELTGLVGDIVELARGSRPAERLDDVQLDTLVDALVDRFERRFPDLTFERTLEPTVVSGEPERIARAVSNLLDNARKWSPSGRHGRGRARRRHGVGARPRPAASRSRTCRTSSTASTAPATRAARRAPGSGSRSSARRPRATGDSSRR